MSKKFRSYSGHGVFDFDLGNEKHQVTADFSLTQYSNSEIIIKLEIDEFLDIPKFRDNSNLKASLKGKVKDPDGTITAKELHFQRLNNTELTLKSLIKPVEIIFKKNESENLVIHAGLTNFVFKICEKLLNNQYGFLAKIDGFDVNFVPRKDHTEIKNALNGKKNKVLVTSEAVISFSKTEIFTIHTILDNVTHLLSYSCRNVINWIYEDYFSEDVLIKTVLRPAMTGDYIKWKKLIGSDKNKCNLKEYLEITYPRYVEFKNAFGLNIVINFYLESIALSYVDLRFLLSTTALETLLGGYNEMRKNEENPIINGIIKRNKKEIIKILDKEVVGNKKEIAEKIAEKVSSPHSSLEEKLVALVEDPRFKIKLKQYDRDFIRIRNDVAHTGKFPPEIKYNGSKRAINLIEEHNRLIYLLDRIILTVLGYKGKPFLNKFNGYKKEIL